MGFEYSELASLYSATGTYTSTSTIPGPGALTGKGIKKLGLAVVSGLDSIIYRRRLSRIERILNDKLGPIPNLDAQDSMQSICDDLLELSRPVYSFSIRTRAFRLIMKNIGSVEIEELALLVVHEPISIAYQHLTDVFTCLWERSSANATEKQLAAFHAAGYKAYANLGRSNDTTRAVLSTVFVTYISLLAVLGDAQFSRMLIELNIVDFLRNLQLNTSSRRKPEGVVCRLLLHILAQNLDPLYDLASHISVSALLGTLLPLLEHHEDQTPSESPFLGAPSADWPWIDSASPPSDLLGTVHQVISSAKMPERVSTETQLVGKKPEEKMLLLGTGESGKTTLLKQLLIAKFGVVERGEYVEYLLRDILRAVRKLVDHACTYGASWSKRAGSNPVCYQYLRAMLSDVPVLSDPDTLRSQLIRFVRDEVKDLSYMRQVLCDETTDYFVELLAKIIKEESFIPTDQDIVHSYVMTTGVHSETFFIQDQLYRVFDVGGQRSERRKWIHCFDHVSVV